MCEALIAVCGTTNYLITCDALCSVDSFFTKLCSTPGQKSEISLSKYLAHQRDHGADTSNSGCSSSVLQDSSTAHQEVSPAVDTIYIYV